MSLEPNEINQIENYLHQTFKIDETEGGMLAQNEGLDDNLLPVANYLAELDAEDIAHITNYMAQTSAEAQEE